MSRTVIHDLVLPIVLKRLQGMGVNIPSYAIVHDEALEDFMDEQLSITLGTIGKADEHCEDLEKKIKEARERDPEGFEQLVAKLLQQYINIKTTLMSAKKIKKGEEEEIPGPPDRFKEMLKKAREVWRRA